MTTILFKKTQIHSLYIYIYIYIYIYKIKKTTRATESARFKALKNKILKYQKYRTRYQ